MTTTPPEKTRDAGTATAFTLILIVALFAFAGLVLDGGLAVAAKVRAVATAQAAARAGADQLDLARLRTTGQLRLDPSHARTAARSWLTRAGATGTVTVTADTVTVAVTDRSRTQLLGLIGVDAIPVAATATAEAVHP